NSFFQPVLRFYSRTLDWFLDHGWLALPILIACGIGVWFFFSSLPFTLLPTGDSGVIRGALLMQEGSSPQQQREMQDKLDPILQDAKGRKPIDDVAMDLRKSFSQLPGVFPTLNPQPVLQINIGATGSQFGRYSYSISGINPDEVYAAADVLGEKLKSYDGFAAPPRSNLFRNQPNLDIEIDRDRASSYGVSVAKVQSLLSAAYSQNYVYLIK